MFAVSGSAAVNAGGAFPAFMRTCYSWSVVPMTQRTDDGTRPARGEERVDGRHRRDTFFGPVALLRHHPRTTIHAGPEVITPRSTHIGGMWLRLALRARLHEKPPQTLKWRRFKRPVCSFGFLMAHFSAPAEIETRAAGAAWRPGSSLLRAERFVRASARDSSGTRGDLDQGLEFGILAWIEKPVFSRSRCLSVV